MFGSFSWTNYFLFVGFLLFAYFIIIGYTCYKKEILRFFGRRDLLQDAVEAPVKRTDLQLIAHELVSELGSVIREAAQHKTVAPELLMALQKKIQDYTPLESSEYKAKINLYIAEELEIYGIHGVSPEEIVCLWKP